MKYSIQEPDLIMSTSLLLYIKHSKLECLQLAVLLKPKLSFVSEKRSLTLDYALKACW
jgi:hypothetical protein